MSSKKFFCPRCVKNSFLNYIKTDKSHNIYSCNSCSLQVRFFIRNKNT